MYKLAVFEKYVVQHLELFRSGGAFYVCGHGFHSGFIFPIYSEFPTLTIALGNQYWLFLMEPYEK